MTRFIRFVQLHGVDLISHKAHNLCRIADIEENEFDLMLRQNE
jgi:hypothetical protein